MNAYPMLAAEDALQLANERLQELRRDAANARLARTNRQPGVVGRIAAAVSSIRAAVTTIDADFTTMPSLNDYPYRS